MAWLAGPVEHRWHSLYLSVLEVSIVEADDLSVSDFETAEALVRSAFGTTFRAHDWLHAVDGVHVLLTEGDAMLAHAAVVTRSLRYGGQVLNTGYVEGVAVRNDHQGRGLGRIVMDHAEP